MIKYRNQTQKYINKEGLWKDKNRGFLNWDLSTTLIFLYFSPKVHEIFKWRSQAKLYCCYQGLGNFVPTSYVHMFL